MTTRPSPRFTLVCDVSGAGEQVADFIESVEQQRFPLERAEVILVDDGSDGAASDLASAWVERRPDLVTRLVSQKGAAGTTSLAEALAVASGEWVSLPDPEDVLAPGYLAALDAFLEREPDVDLAAGSTWMWHTGRGDVINTHPLRYMFSDQAVDLVEDGQHFCETARSAFFPTARLVGTGLVPDPRIPARFRGGHLTARYLLTVERPTVGFVRTARYHQRRTPAETPKAARRDPALFDAALELGFRDLVEEAVRRHGSVPGWLQAQLVVDLGWYFARTDSQLPAGPPVHGPAAERFHDLVALLLVHLDVERQVGRSLAPLTHQVRYALMHGYSAQRWREPFIVVDELDEAQQLLCASYFFTGEPPTEEIWANGTPAAPLHSKRTDQVHLGRQLLSQRLIWLPANQKLRFRLDGEDVPVVYGRPPFPAAQTVPGAVRNNLGPRAGLSKDQLERLVPPPAGSLTERASRRAAGVRPLTRRYADAWVLIDRIHDAADSAEIVFKHLRKNHPSINAWFVLEKGTQDWKRLRTEGYADRLVAHGSLPWKLLMANAAHLVSTHADEAITHPPEILGLTRPRWRFSFLQHGVIKDDLSAWLNRKPIDTFVVSTRDELASIAGDSPYRFSTREVALTGLPRFDRLLEIGARFPPEGRDLLLVSPTWRHQLVPEAEKGVQRRSVEPEVVARSEFMQQWGRFLADERLVAACAKHGLGVGFLPHPILQPVLEHLPLPSHVRRLSYADGDVQEYFARARVAVTDFSSVAFNEAYLDRPLVYFQFDEADVLGGDHVGRAGYFDYRRDGFGPVAVTSEEAVTAVVDALDSGPEPTEPYRERIARTFPPRDGKCSERVVQAILRSARDRSHEEPVATPTFASS